jgi:beta-glucosidase
VAEANPRTAVVLFGGNPLDIAAWVNDVPAIIQAWYPGQEGGHALANLLFEQVNPSGKLPDTLPVRLEDCPAWKTYPGIDHKAHYREGLCTGYRHYDQHNVRPLFPFGFGLSYTTFKYDNLKLSSINMRPADTLQVSVDVTNTGGRTGKEAVQLYIGDVPAGGPRPIRELKDFCKVELRPGEKKTVSFTVTTPNLAFFDVRTNSWKVEPGTFEIMCGPNSQEGLKATFTYMG